MSPDAKKDRQGYRFPSTRLTEAEFQRLDRIRSDLVQKARRTVDPKGSGFDAVMMATSDDGSFFPPTDDAFDDWRDRIVDIISIASRRVSLAVLAGGFAIAGANLVGTDTMSGYGTAGLLASGALGVWAVGANLFGSGASR